MATIFSTTYGTTKDWIEDLIRAHSVEFGYIYSGDEKVGRIIYYTNWRDRKVDSLNKGVIKERKDRLEFLEQYNQTANRVVWLHK